MGIETMSAKVVPVEEDEAATTVDIDGGQRPDSCAPVEEAPGDASLSPEPEGGQMITIEMLPPLLEPDLKVMRRQATIGSVVILGIIVLLVAICHLVSHTMASEMPLWAKILYGVDIHICAVAALALLRLMLVDGEFHVEKPNPLIFSNISTSQWLSR